MKSHVVLDTFSSRNLFVWHLIVNHTTLVEALTEFGVIEEIVEEVADACSPLLDLTFRVGLGLGLGLAIAIGLLEGKNDIDRLALLAQLSHFFLGSLASGPLLLNRVG